jgi:hypothetical protein
MLGAWGFLFLGVLTPAGRAQDVPVPPAKPPEQFPLPQSLPDEPVVPDRPPIVPPRLTDGFDGADTFGGGGGRGGGMGGFGGLGASGPNGPAILALTDRTMWVPNQRVGGQGTSFGFVKENLGLSVPLYRDGVVNTFAFTTGVGATIYTGNALLPETGTPFPNTIWNIHFGGNYSHLFSNDWLATIGASIGSTSDHPFANWTQVNFGLHALLRVPVGEHNAWLFSLSYSPLGQLGFPVPGVAFQWVPNDWLRMNIGVPFQVIITPTPDWQFTASYMLLTTIHTQLSYRVAPHLRIFSGYDWQNEGFHLAENVNPHDRFLYYEMKLNVGTRLTWGQFRFDVLGGWAFDRYFAQGGGPFTTRNRIDIGNGPYLGLNASYRW